MNSIIIFVAKYFFVLSIIVAAVYFLKESKEIKKKLVICGVIVAPLSYILAKIGGFLYYDARPFVVGHFIPLIQHAADNGFPSDHTLLTAAVAMIVSFYNKKMGALLWVIAVLVGVARVAAGIHHLTDIVGSIVIVLISGAVYYFTLGKKQKVSQEPSGAYLEK